MTHLALLALVATLSGCALGSRGLPGGLPIPPGGGGSVLTITTSGTVDAVQGRTYGASFATSGGTGALSQCTISGGALPGGLTVAVDGGNNSRCRITGTASGAPGTYNFTIRAQDTAGTPAIGTRSYSIVVRSEFQITTAALAAAVESRQYGQPRPTFQQPIATNISGTVGAGPVAGCPAPAANPPGVTETLSGGTCFLEAALIAAGSAGVHNIQLNVTDTGLTDPVSNSQAVPPATISLTLPLTVGAPLVFTLTQTGNPTPTNPAALLDAVEARSYAQGGQAAAAPSYAVAGGFGAGTYRFCVLAGAIPAGFVTAPIALPTCAAPAATNGPVTVTSAAAGAAGANGFTIQVDDGGGAANPAVPPGTLSHAVTLTIQPPLAVAINQANPLNAAVQNRAYGQGGLTPILYTASGGIPAYVFTAPPFAAAPGGGALPTGFACAPAATTLTCSSAGVTGSASGNGSAGTGYTGVLASVADTGNAAVPAGNTNSATRDLTVFAPLSFVINSPAVGGAAPNGTLPDGVVGRPYGAPLTDIVFTGQGGLSSLTGYNVSITGSFLPFGIVCSNTGARPAAATNVSTCNSGGAGLAGAPGIQNIAYSVSDVANASVAAGTQLADTNGFTNYLVNVRAALQFTAAPAPGGAAPNGTFPDGVIGRTYGAPLTDIVFVASGGLSATTGYNVVVGGTFLANGIVCSNTGAQPAAATNTSTCNSGGGNLAGATGARTLTYSVTDNANSTTPAGVQNADTGGFNNYSVNVNAALAIAINQANPLNPAVQGRAYGTGGLVALVYTASGGNPGYTFTPPPTAAAPGAGALPGGFACAPAATTLTCSSPNVTGTPGNYTAIPASVTDTANATTPAGTTNAATRDITVAAGLIITLNQAGNPGSPNPASLLNAVVGRNYGTGGQAAGAPTYTVTGGNGPGSYVWCISAGALPASFVTTPAISTNCGAPTSTNGPVTVTSANATVAGGPTSFTIQVDDGSGGNPSVPAGGATNTTQITVNAALAVSVTPDPALNDAVTGRSYGDAPQATPTYSATGGEGAYTWNVSVGAPPTGISCNQVGQTFECNTGGGTVTGGTASFTSRVVDAGNSAVPSGNATLAKTITVQPAITVTTAQAAFTNGLVNFPYAPNGTPLTLAASGGLGGFTWVQPGSSTAPCSGGSAPTGTFPNGLALSAAGLISGSPTVASNPGAPATNPFTFAPCVFDTANATTPAGPALPVASYTVFVLRQVAYVAGQGNSTVEVIDTNPGSSITAIATTAGDGLSQIAIRPDGLRAYVTAANVDLLRVIDTIDDAAAVGSIALGTCTTPRGIAAGVTSVGARAYVACGNGEIAVVNAGTDAFIAATGALGSAGASLTGIAINPAGTLVYALDTVNSELIVIDVTTNAEIVGSPFALAGLSNVLTSIVFNASGSQAYITDSGNNQLGVLNTAGNSIGSTIALGSSPTGLAITPDGTRVFVALTGTDEFSVVDTGTNTLVANSPIALTAGDVPVFVAIPPLSPVPGSGFRVYIVANGADSVLIHDNSAPTFPANAASPIGLTAGGGFQGITAMHVPR